MCRSSGYVKNANPVYIARSILVNRKRILIRRGIIIALLVTVLCATALILLHNKYIKKENNLVLFSNSEKAQQIYILGTIHEYHFNSWLGYSYLDVQNVIHNVQPDLLLLEVDQGAYEQYGVIKSPVEMVPLWCYAEEHDIAVKGVDWFEVTEDSRSWTTDETRDDHIFKNTLAAIEDERVVLIILGATHRMEQAKRFEASGYLPQSISDKTMLFQADGSTEFTYPANSTAELKNQIAYWNTIAKDEVIAVTTENSEGRKYWLGHYEKLSSSLQAILGKVFIPNALFQ